MNVQLILILLLRFLSKENDRKTIAFKNKLVSREIYMCKLYKKPIR